MVECVGRFETELDGRALMQTLQREDLHHGQIGSEVIRCADCSVAPGSVAERIKRRQYEDLRVGEVVVDPARSVVAMRPAHNVGTLRTIGRQRGSVIGGHIQRTASGDTPDAVRNPSTENGIEYPRHAAPECLTASEGQSIYIADLQNMRNIERGEASFEPRFVWILEAEKTSDPRDVIVVD